MKKIIKLLLAALILAGVLFYGYTLFQKHQENNLDDADMGTYTYYYRSPAISSSVDEDEEKEQSNIYFNTK